MTSHEHGGIGAPRGVLIRAVALEDGSDTAVFQYDPAFARSGIQVSPITMPLRTGPYAFPTLAYEAFRGLPGLLVHFFPRPLRQRTDRHVAGLGGAHSGQLQRR